MNNLLIYTVSSLSYLYAMTTCHNSGIVTFKKSFLVGLIITLQFLKETVQTLLHTHNVSFTFWSLLPINYLFPCVNHTVSECMQTPLMVAFCALVYYLKGYWRTLLYLNLFFI